MDAIDAALLSAWSNLAPALRADRAEALRRAARLSAATLRRPIRPWCCCIRASDTRMTSAAQTSHRPAPHTLNLSPARLRSLCAPVHIDWPGQRWTIVADKLGQHPESLRSWIARGVFRSRLVHPNTVNSRGKPVPILWTTSPIDPNAELARAPDPHWGTLWLDLHTQIPDAASLRVRRVPVFSHYTRPNGTIDQRFRGYNFLCPGLDPTKPCNRPVSRLYLPIPTWTIHHAHYADLSPSQDDARDTRWACRRCHRIRYISFVERNGWNHFIAHLTSGLLYGHEVERPASFKPKRKRTYKPHPRPAPRTARAKSLHAQGKSHKQIAQELNIKLASVPSYLKRSKKPLPEGGVGVGDKD